MISSNVYYTNYITAAGHSRYNRISKIEIDALLPEAELMWSSILQSSNKMI